MNSARLDPTPSAQSKALDLLSLDYGGEHRFADRVRRTIKKALIAVLFAVSASGSGHSAVVQHELHAGVQAGSEHFVQAGTLDDGSYGHRHGIVLHAAHAGHDGPAPGHPDKDPSCAHGHVHCCASAILTTSHAIVTVEPTLPRLGRGSAMPYGQRFHPPLRPPRSAA